MIDLLHGEAAALLPRYAGEAALVYVDPLFGTGRIFSTRSGEVAFEDRFPSAAAFRAYLEELLVSARNALAPHGALWIHCDPSFQPIARELGDGLFSSTRGGLADQIVWHYRRWPVKGPRCNQVHDYLLRYVRDHREARWTQIYQPLAESTRRQWGTRKQKAMVRDGVRRKSIATQDESPGAPIGDVWLDINIVAPCARERTGFPTQKPEALLQRILTISTVDGDLVIDPTCGSGSTLAAARKLGRRAVGIDRSEVAIRYTQERLAQPQIGRAA